METCINVTIVTIKTAEESVWKHTSTTMPTLLLTFDPEMAGCAPRPCLLTDIYRTGKPLLPGDRIQRCGVYRLEYRWASTPPWWSTYHGSNWAGEQLPDYNVNAINCYASHFLIEVQPEKAKSNTCWWDGDEVVCEVGSDGEGCWHGDRFSVSPIWTKSTRKIRSSPPAGQGVVKER